MTRNSLYLLIGALLVVAVGLGIYIYNEQTKPDLEIRVDQNGLTVDGNG
jgi:hypothetical protein